MDIKGVLHNAKRANLLALQNSVWWHWSEVSRSAMDSIPFPSPSQHVFFILYMHAGTSNQAQSV